MERVGRSTRAIRFGIFEVNLRAEELRKNGIKLRLRGQPFQVLVMLLERPGELVTREELQQKLWPEGTFVDFDRGLNTTINKIREALGDSAEHPRFVETLARRGYRFIAPVEREAIEDTPDRGILADKETQADRAERRRAVVVISAASAMALMVAAWFWLYSHRQSSALTESPQRVTPLTSYPQDEDRPAISPDGKLVAFAWTGEKDDNWDIYVKSSSALRPLRLTTDPRVETCPVWSPNGERIAFVRGPDGGGYDILVVPALGGPEQKLYSVQKGWGQPFIAWSPDGKYIAFTEVRPPENGSGISLLSMETLETQRLTSGPAQSGMGGDCRQVFSPDGKSLAFIRNDISLDEIYLAPVSGGNPKRLTSEGHKMGGLTWTPDGRQLIFSSSRSGYDSNLWRISIDGGPIKHVDVPGQGIDFPFLSREGDRLAYTATTADLNIWRTRIGHTGALSQPAQCIASTRHDTNPQYSPDGKRIAFIAGPWGDMQLWICDSNGQNLIQPTNAEGVGSPRWSPDGQWIAFDNYRERHNADIYVVTAAGSKPRRITSESSNDVVPDWSKDGQWIFFGSDRSGSWQIWKVPHQGGSAVRVTRNGGLATIESRDPNRFVYYFKEDVPGVWRVSEEGGNEEQVLNKPRPVLGRFVSVSKEGVYFVDPMAKPCPAIEFFSFATRRTTKIVEIQRRLEGWNPGLTVSPDGQWILWSQYDQWGRDIMLVENFRWDK